MNHLQPTDDIVASNSWNRMVKVTDGSQVGQALPDDEAVSPE